MGWSNGALFAQMYAIARHTAPTPGGNRVAAAAVFAGGDPLLDPVGGEQPTCAMTPAPRTTVPIYMIHRSCDSALPCSAEQAQKFNPPPGFDVEGWLARLRSTLGDPNTQDRIIDAQAQAALACEAAIRCGFVEGLANHLHWPDGLDDQSGVDWEPEMLAFLRDHPLTR
jgi:hypothetical protein